MDSPEELVVWFAWLIPVALSAPAEVPGRVWQQLGVGMYQRALMDLPDGDSPDHQLVRGWAKAGDYKCDEAMPLLEAGRASSHWDALPAVSEALCRRTYGDAAGALVALEEATALDPRRPGPWMHLAITRFEVGDHDGAEAALAELEGGGPLAERRIAYVRAIDAVRHGGDEAWWAVEDFADSIVGTAQPAQAEQNLAILRAELWMAVDELDEAAAVLAQAIERYGGAQRIPLYRAEILRRLGEPEEARLILNRPAMRSERRPLRLAILARVYVDQGRLVEAAALLDAHPDPTDPDYLASRWYLARAGDEALAAWQDQWRAVVPDADRSLDHLIPVHERTP